MTEPESSSQATGRSKTSAILLAGKIIFGLGLALLMVVIVSGLRDDGAGPGFMDSPPQQDDSPHAAPAANPQLSPLEQARANRSSLALEGIMDPVKVFAEPRPDAAEIRAFSLHAEEYDVITFMALSEHKEETGGQWYEVQLPQRPNGSRGWVRAGDVTPYEMAYKLVVDISDFRLDLLERGEKLRSFPIGLGRKETPTPLGEYFLTVKVEPYDTKTVYGVLVLGVSAYSEKLTDWPGGGQVGIHGTNNPEASLGKNVSNGCIRLRNEDILAISDLAPVGTPVLIQE